MMDGEFESLTAWQPARRGDIVVKEMDDEAVLYDERSGAVHRFNETALTVWKACDGSRQVSEISQVLVERYALGSAEARTEVETVIRDLEDKGLLLESAEPTDHQASRLPSRRELLCGGTAKLIYTAPLISTFFATGACASGPSASLAFGTDAGGGCKTIGYSCSINNDCCQNPARTKCRSADNNCCCQHLEVCCTVDADCCNAGDTCNSGTCS